MRWRSSSNTLAPFTAPNQRAMSVARRVVVLVFVRGNLCPPLGLPLAVFGHGRNLLKVKTIHVANN